MKIRCLALSLVVLAAGPALADCPPGIDIAAKTGPLLLELRDTGNELEARQVMNELWQLWTTAPDERAQDYLDTGMARRRVADLRGAWDEFDQLVAYCPDYAEGYNQRAFVAFLLEDYQSSIDDLEKALELDPTHLGALTGKALAEIGLGGPEAGQDTLRQALALNPWLSERRLLIEEPGTDL